MYVYMIYKSDIIYCFTNMNLENNFYKVIHNYIDEQI